MWGELLGDSILRPRAAARRLLDLPLPPRAVAEAAVAVACLAVVLGYGALTLVSGAMDPLTVAVLDRPFLGVAVQVAVMAGLAFLTWWVGGRMGGKGDPLGAAKIVVWINMVMVAIQAAQLVALLLAPPLASFLAVATLVWLFWAYANFTAELHDFASPLIVLGVAVLTAVGLALGLAMVASLFGLTPQGAP